MYKMDRRGSAELLNCETNHSKHASCDSLASDSKSSSLNSKLGQESVSIQILNSM
jgi:myotubularin-related protein 1/2